MSWVVFFEFKTLYCLFYFVRTCINTKKSNHGIYFLFFLIDEKYPAFVLQTLEKIQSQELTNLKQSVHRQNEMSCPSRILAHSKLFYYAFKNVYLALVISLSSFILLFNHCFFSTLFTPSSSIDAQINLFSIKSKKQNSALKDSALLYYWRR